MNSRTDVWVMTDIDRYGRHLGLDSTGNCIVLTGTGDDIHIGQRSVWHSKMEDVLWLKPERDTATRLIFTLANNSNACSLHSLNYVIIHTLYYIRYQ